MPSPLFSTPIRRGLPAITGASIRSKDAKPASAPRRLRLSGEAPVDEVVAGIDVAVLVRRSSAGKLLLRPAKALFGVLAFLLALPQVSQARGPGALDLRAIQREAFASVAGLGLELLKAVRRGHGVNPARQLV
jgi:hypothetical protein